MLGADDVELLLDFLLMTEAELVSGGGERLIGPPCLNYHATASPDGSTLAVGNVEGAIDLYDVARWTRLARCRGHSTKVTQLDWSRDAALLQSNCNAYEILYWEGRSGRQVCSPQREYTQWDGWSCTLGWPVMGIWQEGFDPSDVNAAHASDDGSLLVVSDDRGGVCLYRFPCVAPRAAYSRAAGHASHVCSVRWLLGSGRCVSVGGHDRAVPHDAAERVGELHEQRLAERDQARRAGDYRRADALREELRQAGIEIWDTREGSQWRAIGATVSPAADSARATTGNVFNGEPS